MEDLLLDNFYMKRAPQMPPEPATIPKDSSYNEFIQSHFTQQQIEQLNQKQRAKEQEAEARLR
jgi:hypothetical protein